MQSYALGEFAFISAKPEAWSLPLWAQRSYLMLGDLLSSKELVAKLQTLKAQQQPWYMAQYKVQVAEAGLTLLEVRWGGGGGEQRGLRPKQGWLCTVFYMCGCGCVLWTCSRCCAGVRK
jgi:hypothetical protein